MTVPAAIKQKSAIKSALLAPSSLENIPWLLHGFSTRPGGVTTEYGAKSLNLGFTKDDNREHVQENRQRLLKKLGAGRNWPLITLRQVHSDVIHVVRSTQAGPLTGDGVI